MGAAKEGAGLLFVGGAPELQSALQVQLPKAAFGGEMQGHKAVVFLGALEETPRDAETAELEVLERAVNLLQQGMEAIKKGEACPQLAFVTCATQDSMAFCLNRKQASANPSLIAQAKTNVFPQEEKRRERKRKEGKGKEQRGREEEGMRTHTRSRSPAFDHLHSARA